MALRGFVTSIMRKAIFCPEDELVSSIAEKMILNDIGAIIITRNGRPIGIITEKDIVERIVRWPKDPKKTHAKDIMSKPVVTIGEDKSITDVFKLMRDKKLRRLVVVDRESNAIGLVTERRVLDALIR